MAPVVRPPESVPWAGHREIAQLAFPILYGEVVGVITPLVVVAIMGRVDEGGLYARSLYMPLAFLFVALQVGFEISCQVAASTSRGGERPQDVLPMVMNLIRLGAVAWGILTLAIALCAPLIASLFAVPPEETGDFVSFVRWFCAANLLWLPFSLISSSLRGYGHAQSAAVAVLVAAGAEIGVVAILGFGTDLGMYALPIATAAGGVTGLAYAFAALVKTDIWRVRGSFDWQPGVVSRLMSVGGPVTISFLVIAVGNFSLVWVVAPFGADVVSGFSAAATLEALILVPSTAIGSATAIVMNRLRGAGRPEIMPAALRSGLVLACLAYAVLALALWLLRAPLAALVAGAPDVAEQAERLLTIVGLTYGCMGVTVTAILVIQQVGGGLIALAMNIPYFLGSVAIGALIVESAGVQGLYWTVAVLNVVGVLVAPPVALRFVRRGLSGGVR